jgi:hypothetical protein
MEIPSRLRVMEIVAIVTVVVGSTALAIVSAVASVPTAASFSVLGGLIATLALYLVSANTLLERRLVAVEHQDVNRGSEIVSQKEWYEHLAVAVKTANTSIDITHHEPRLPTMSGITAKREVFSLLYRRIKQRRVLVRMLIAINTPEKLAWVEELLTKFSNCPNLDIKHSEADLQGATPSLSIQVVDGSRGFAIDMGKGHHTLSELDTDLYTREPAVAQQLNRYYAAYWGQCQWIKEGGIVHRETLAEIADALDASPEDGSR